MGDGRWEMGDGRWDAPMVDAGPRVAVGRNRAGGSDGERRRDLPVMSACGLPVGAVAYAIRRTAGRRMDDGGIHAPFAKSFRIE
ncbi:protein of unknown function [Burkholderia multivorans]